MKTVLIIYNFAFARVSRSLEKSVYNTALCNLPLPSHVRRDVPTFPFWRQGSHDALRCGRSQVDRAGRTQSSLFTSVGKVTKVGDHSPHSSVCMTPEVIVLVDHLGWLVDLWAGSHHDPGCYSHTT